MRRRRRGNRRTAGTRALLFGTRGLVRMCVRSVPPGHRREIRSLGRALSLPVGAFAPAAGKKRRTVPAKCRPASERKGRESNPQGSSLARVPGGSRRRSGSPSVFDRRAPILAEWSRVDSNHRSSPRQRDVLAAGRRDPFVRNTDSTPARTRTRNTSLEARDDRPFHHRGRGGEGRGGERKARDSNPHSPRGSRFSKAVRPGRIRLPSRYECARWTRSTPTAPGFIIPARMMLEWVRLPA